MYVRAVRERAQKDKRPTTGLDKQHTQVSRFLFEMQLWRYQFSTSRTDTFTSREREREPGREKKGGISIHIYNKRHFSGENIFFLNTHKDTKTTSDAFICVEMSNRISNGYMCQIPSVCVCVRGKRETGPKRDGE